MLVRGEGVVSRKIRKPENLPVIAARWRGAFGVGVPRSVAASCTRPVARVPGAQFLACGCDNTRSRCSKRLQAPGFFCVRSAARISPRPG